MLILCEQTFSCHPLRVEPTREDSYRQLIDSGRALITQGQNKQSRERAIENCWQIRAIYRTPVEKPREGLARSLDDEL